MAAVPRTLLRAYRWHYIFSGTENSRFAEILRELITPEQGARIAAALVPLAADA
ncbi:MAG: hypothetical protein ACXW2L_19490 [Burkholderiales bacterium]